MTNAFLLKQAAGGRLDKISDILLKGRDLPENKADFESLVTELVAQDKEIRADLGKMPDSRNEAPAGTSAGVHPDVKRFVDAQKARQQKEEQNKFNPGASIKSDMQSALGHYTGNPSSNK